MGFLSINAKKNWALGLFLLLLLGSRAYCCCSKKKKRKQRKKEKGKDSTPAPVAAAPKSVRSFCRCLCCPCSWCNNPHNERFTSGWAHHLLSESQPSRLLPFPSGCWSSNLLAER